MQLDSFDRRILDLLQRDAQTKVDVIADRVGLSASAVQRRIRKLKAEHVITGEVVVVNPKAAGNMMTFVAGVEIERENYEALGRFREWVAQNDNIQQLYYVTGSLDLVVIILARDTEHYDGISAEMMKAHRQIRRVTTHVVLKSLKTGLALPLLDVNEAE